MSVSRPKRSELDPSLCLRCRESKAAVTVRKDPLCKTCFDKYVASKIVKRMDSFRVRHAEPGREVVLILALSCGPSSTTLLHILDGHLQRQEDRSGRVGFKLHMVHFPDVHGHGDTSQVFDQLKTCYPRHTYSLVRLSETIISQDLSEVLTSARIPEERIGNATDILDSLKSKSSRDDMMQILLRKSLVDFANQHNGHAILWGDSTTTIAGRTLAETAKGRGSGLPWIAADGDSIHGLPFYFPMRDLLTKEVVEYVSLQQPRIPAALDSLSGAVVSTKNTSIDELTKQYFGSADKDYPSIVANVVRTTDKMSRELAAAWSHCELCDMPLHANAPAKSRLCTGCIRTLSQPAT